MQTFPIPAPLFNGSSRRVDAGSALDWLKQGWAMFVVNPGVWIAMMVILIVIYLGLQIVPMIGQLAAHLLTPLLAGGMLIGCQKVADQQRLEIADLFAGFQRSTGALATLGVLYMLGMLVIVLLIVVFAGGGVAGGMMMQESIGAGIAVGGMLLALLIEFAVAPHIRARDNLALWHGVGTAMYAVQWLCAGALLWRQARAPGG